MLSCPPDLSLKKLTDSRPFRRDQLLMKRLRIRNLARIISLFVFLSSVTISPAQEQTRPLPQAVLTSAISPAQKQTRPLPQAVLTSAISPAQQTTRRIGTRPESAARNTSTSSNPPRLVLLIVVDQFRYD